ncbi:uncharacterized protein LTR77_000156 [Saxophila tyrrhenica]|uniref:Bromo domain-containing protein n=1 Tax=Saxophila tyrrhenica TaxID=1690608 RepID=A0AAV9PNA3_9PEZI|nr:hypothetical protein LTR77_000156 [Saxophila tyrrhenica]
MSFPTAYTPLESLLLFQALRAEGVNSHAVFNRISEQLKKVSFVQGDPSYDSGRLSPDALRELYLWLLKEEVKRDAERQADRDDLLRNGSLDPAQRKRKAPSPSLPTVHEASQHAHLIPQLVTRLYARYRDHAVKGIREQERKYHALQRDIGEIEEGKWDEGLRQRTASRTQSPRPSASTHTQPAGHKVDGSHSAAASPVPPGNSADSATTKPYKGNKIGDVMNHGPEPPNGTTHRRTSSGTVLPPLSEMAPQSPRFGIPPKVPGPLSTQVPNNNGYHHSPTTGHQSPYGTHHGHPVSNSMASPQVQNALSRPSSSPRPILPPPPGMKLPPPSPGPHSASPNMHGPPVSGHQQYPHPPPHRLSNAQSPSATYGYPPPHQAHPPHQQGYYQAPQYQDRRTSYPPPQGQYPMQPPHAGGYQLPPFPVDGSQQGYAYPSNYAPQPGYPPRQSQHHQYPPSAPTTVQRPPAQDPRLVSDIVAALATPQPRPKLNKSFKRPLPTLDLGTPMPSPVTEIEPFSPVLERAKLPGRQTTSKREQRAAEAEQSPEPEPVPKSTRTRARTKRDRSPHSVVSSTADDLTRGTRSQSVSTAAGALPPSDDRPTSRGDVKIEPSTPAGIVDLPESSHEYPPVPGSGPMTRKRRGTLQSQHHQPPSKRARQRSPDRGPSVEDWATPPPRPTTITATRNLNKISAAIMQDIERHKHASYFANQVRDKDAPGYSEIIKNPQSFKSVRGMLTAGAKAVNAASASSDSPSTSTADTAAPTVDLDRSADLMPPKAIVNAAQLEKEILRVFANAVMFNPGEDGMVKVAREMCADVEGKVGEWRGSSGEEEGRGGSEVLDAGEEDGGRGKRRKG